MEWHLEDVDDTEIDDLYPDAKYQVPWQLLERPQKQLPPDESQHLTRREMWALTSRHMGVTGNAFWYLDQLESPARTPLDILYIAPWRMWPVPDPRRATSWRGCSTGTSRPTPGRGWSSTR